METRHRLPAVGGFRALGIRRGAFHILSAWIMDTGRGARRTSSLEDGSRCILLDCSDGGGNQHVRPGSAVAAAVRRAVCRCVLRVESISPVDLVLGPGVW